MSKPVWISLVRSGRSVCEAFLHEPSEDSLFGGVWVKYVPDSELEKAEARIAELEAESKELSKLLGIALCPQCDGSGGYYDGYGEVCQCQWCDEKKKALQPIPTQDEK